MTVRAVRPALLAGLLLVVGTNLFVAAGVVRNRMGEPDAVLVLTERELGLPRYWAQRDEDSGVTLSLEAHLDDFRLDRDQLRDLGFDVELPLDDPRASRIYGKTLPRRALVVLELEGDSWTRWIAEREDSVRRVESRRAVDEALAERRRRDLRQWQVHPVQEARLEELRPLYRATLAFGRRFEPVLRDVTLLETETSGQPPDEPGDAADSGPQ